MAVSAPRTRQLTDLELMGHLFRRAGFGATREQLEAAVAKGYDATVEELLHPETQPPFEEDICYRYYIHMRETRFHELAQDSIMYRLIASPRVLQEKMTLFWHHLFATGQAKVNNGPSMVTQMNMLRANCLGSFRTLLVELSKDPAMIFWLDNQMNTKDVHNENYGRELLELFSMGIGNYTEDDVKNCARAFTGWTMKSSMPGPYPYGRYPWQFKFDPDQHDYGEKEFLGERGSFDGEDVIDIIVRHPATAQFIARRLYNFFVSERNNQAAIDELAEVFRSSNYDIRAVMRALFMSDWFRSADVYYSKIKSPAEHVAGVTRLVGDYQFPEYGMGQLTLDCRYMGQDLLNPPSVEGWHTGKEWIDTGTLVQRINFAVDRVGDTSKPGVRAIIERMHSKGELTPDQFVERCLDLIGPLDVADKTRSSLVDFAAKGGPLRFRSPDDPAAAQRVAEMLQMIVATREFQLA
ncbi:MAG: DUF1800 domain-containing protein [Chloroflexota bacterium]